MPSMFVIVLARVFLSVSANTVQKRLVLQGASIRSIWLLTYAFMLVPTCLLALLCTDAVTGAFWWNIGLGGILDAIGNLTMVAALRATDLSVFGPLNALRPVLALLFGWLFLSETPTATGGLGLAVTVAGTFFLLRTGNEPSIRQAGWRRILALRVLGLSLSTAGAVFLKRAAFLSSVEMTLAGWTACGLICLLLTFSLQKENVIRQLPAAFAHHRNWLLLHAGCFLVMQWLTICIFQRALLAYSFAFFQLGMILQVVAGRFVFREPSFRWRMAGCAAMGLGSLLIFWKG